MRTGAVASATLFGILSISSTAFAGGFEVGENGPRAVGRGGAYVSSVDEPSAVYYNPAALTRLGGYAATLNLNLIAADISFQRDPFEFNTSPSGAEFGERRIEFEETRDEAGIFPAPMLFLGSNFGLENWGFGFGVYGPPAIGRKQYQLFNLPPEDATADEVDGIFNPVRDDRNTENDESVITREGGGSYMAADIDLLLFYPSLAAAYRIDQINLSLGVTLQAAVLFVDYGLAVDGLFGPGSAGEVSEENYALYTPNRLEVSGVAPTGIIGALWEPSERISVGASYRPAYTIEANGTIDIEYPRDLASQNPQVDDDGATLSTPQPHVVRLGVNYTHLDEAGSEVFDVELATNYETWSKVDGFDVQLDGALSDDTGTIQNQALPDLFLPRNWNDTVSVRLGGDISALRNAEGNGPVFRLGGFFETSTADEEWTNLDFLAFQRIGLAAGFSYHISRFAFDIAYMNVLSPERVVDNGEYELLAPLWECNDPQDDAAVERCAEPGLDPTHPVNNGTYNINYQLVSLGVTYGW